MFLLVPAYPGCPGSKAVKRSLLLLLLFLLSAWTAFSALMLLVGRQEGHPVQWLLSHLATVREVHYKFADKDLL